MQMTHYIDWYSEYRINPDRWHNHGRRVAVQSCVHKTKGKSETNMMYSGWCEKCGFYEDSCEPMMNYGYPLYCLPDDEKILRIIQETCLTVMEDTVTTEYFLVLCGGGMDLSQSIAYAYLLAGQRIPDELVFEVCTQPCLSVSKKEYVEVMQACINELENISQRVVFRKKEIKSDLNKLCDNKLKSA